MSTMNRLGNCKNPYQGKSKKVLCVCSAGLLRSPTAANVIHREFGHNTRAAGVSHEYALIPVDEVLLHWADEIVVMESWMAQELQNRAGGYSLDIYALNVPDRYSFMDEELQSLILKAYKDLQIMARAHEQDPDSTGREDGAGD